MVPWAFGDSEGAVLFPNKPSGTAGMLVFWGIWGYNGNNNALWGNSRKSNFLELLLIGGEILWKTKLKN